MSQISRPSPTSRVVRTVMTRPFLKNDADQSRMIFATPSSEHQIRALELEIGADFPHTL